MFDLLAGHSWLSCAPATLVAMALVACVCLALGWRKTRRAMDMATAVKSEFLSNMSHELRTPLNGIVGMAELLAGTQLDADQRDMVSVIQRSTDALTSMVNSILNFSAIEAGVIELEHTPFHLRAEVEQVARLAATRAHAKGLKFESHLDPRLPPCVKGDRLGLRQVLTNLLSNTVKFTETGGIDLEVTLAGDPDDRLAIFFRVHDTGIGIDPATAGRLFTPFTQGDSGTTRRFGGAGLGLAIAHRLVIRMNGSIGVESTPGKGSTFWFLLPFPAAESAEISSQAACHPAVPHPAPARAGRILIVDDNPVNQIVVARAVHSLGFAAEVVSGGEAAVEAVANESFDLILMDCQMPGMDGYAAAAEIRQREKTQNGAVRPIAIVAMTANPVEGDQERCFAAGMDDYLPKPLRLETLGHTLDHWLADAATPASAPATPVPACPTRPYLPTCH